jgi:hypothetical protein
MFAAIYAVTIDRHDRRPTMTILLLLLACLLSVVIWQPHRIGWVIFCMSMDQLDVNNRARIEARADTSPEDRAKALGEWENFRHEQYRTGPWTRKFR